MFKVHTSIRVVRCSGNKAHIFRADFKKMKRLTNHCSRPSTLVMPFDLMHAFGSKALGGLSLSPYPEEGHNSW